MLRKYIIINGSPLLFSNEVAHEEVFGKIDGIESAGFFMIYKSKEEQKLKVGCFCESHPLSVLIRPELDQQIITCFLKLEE